MAPRRPLPILIWQGRQHTITPHQIVAMAEEGFTPGDYVILDLIRDYYGFPTIGVLLTDALGRCGMVEPQPPRTKRTGGRQ